MVCLPFFWLPSAPPRADFAKDYASGIAAIITLFIGIPIAAASSVAVILLAAATVEATREAPFYEQTKTTLETIVALHDRWAPLVSALNRVDIAIIALTRALERLDYPARLSDIEDREDDQFDWFSMKSLATLWEKLEEEMLCICKNARITLRDPLVRAELSLRMSNAALLLEKEFPEAFDPSGIAALISFSDRAEAEAVKKRHDQVSDRLRNGYVIQEDGENETGAVTAIVHLKPGASLAVAGLALWEIPEDFDNEGFGQGPYLITTTRSEAFPAAAYLHDLLVLLPTPVSINDFMKKYVQDFGLHVDPTMIHSNTNIYAPSLSLNSGLLPAAAEFAAKLLTLKHRVGDQREVN